MRDFLSIRGVGTLLASALLLLVVCSGATPKADQPTNSRVRLRDVPYFRNLHDGMDHRIKIVNPSLYKKMEQQRMAKKIEKGLESPRRNNKR